MITEAERAVALKVIVRSTGRIARFCDRAQHNEENEKSAILEAASDLRHCGFGLTKSCGLDPIVAYTARLAAIEARSPLAGQNHFDVLQETAGVTTMRQLQALQAKHDMYYHPDVSGLPKVDQLQHIVLHLAKLAWLIQDVQLDPDIIATFKRTRFVDVLIFGVKLATVCGHVLPESRVRT